MGGRVQSEESLRWRRLLEFPGTFSMIPLGTCMWGQTGNGSSAWGTSVSSVSWGLGSGVPLGPEAVLGSAAVVGTMDSIISTEVTCEAVCARRLR